MQLKFAIDPSPSDPSDRQLVEYLKGQADDSRFHMATLYHKFPIFRDDSGELVEADVLLVVPQVGVLVFVSTNLRDSGDEVTVKELDQQVSRVGSYLYSRLLKFAALRKSLRELKFELVPVLFAPSFPTDSIVNVSDGFLLTNQQQLDFCLNNTHSPEFTEQLAREVCSVIEGARNMSRVKPRKLPVDPNSLGKQVEILELSIAELEQNQFRSASSPLRRPQRVRGLAGSGKTIILAMKAALMHLRDPEAKILYTFYTKSLYQQVRLLITRFYRQFDERDPNWSKIIVMHGWGGSAAPGVYSTACRDHGVRSISLKEAPPLWVGGPFAYVCSELLNAATIKETYDYILVDEGQDFPASFLILCSRLAKDQRFIWAYDDLQTIFQTEPPSPDAIFGKSADGKSLVELEEDIILFKCYRNPREILVCAHAIGFGLYGPRIRQMLESAGSWHDLGYEVISGNFVAGKLAVIHRPAENSLTVISEKNAKEDIVSVRVASDFDEEIRSVVAGTKADLKQGLRKDDILIVCVDDRSARSYFEAIEKALASEGIYCNNMHKDSFELRDFTVDERVTLSTIHKAKGNEAYAVYIVGVDALFPDPNVRDRNILFTAMTRAKGWLRISGVGDQAKACKQEIDDALAKFPNLEFKYPSPGQIRVIKRDLAEAAIAKLEYDRMIEDMIQRFGADAVESFVKAKAAAAKGKPPRKSKP